MSADGIAFGIVYPHRARGRRRGRVHARAARRADARRCSSRARVIYTSGLGGTFPRGITIGTIVQRDQDGGSLDAHVSVRPAVTPSRVTTVLVLTAQRVTQGTGNVWGATVNADSATRRIAAAGDSLARQAGAARGAGAAGGARLGEARDDRLGATRARRGAAADSAARDSRRRPRGAQPARHRSCGRRPELVARDTTVRAARLDSPRYHSKPRP